MHNTKMNIHNYIYNDVILKRMQPVKILIFHNKSDTLH